MKLLAWVGKAYIHILIVRGLVHVHAAGETTLDFFRAISCWNSSARFRIGILSLEAQEGLSCDFVLEFFLLRALVRFHVGIHTNSNNCHDS